MPMELHDVPPGFLKDVEWELDNQEKPLLINIKDLQLFLPLYSAEARKEYTGYQLEAIANIYFKISKGGLKELRYCVNKDPKNDIVLKSLSKKEIEIGDGFYLAMNEMKRHGHDPAFSKKSNMRRIDKLMKESVRVIENNDNILENFLENF